MISYWNATPSNPKFPGLPQKRGGKNTEATLDPPLRPSWHMWSWVGGDSSVNEPSFLSWCYNAVNCVYGWQTDVFTGAYKRGLKWPPDRNKHEAVQLKVQYNGPDLRWLAFLNSHNPFCRLRNCPAKKTYCDGVELVGVIYIAKGR